MGMIEITKRIWEYRAFIFGLVKRDFNSKYLNSSLGFLWAILNPLALILVYTVIFTEIMQAKLPEIQGDWAYSIYLCAGVLPWNYFVETILRLLNLYLEQGNSIKKVSFPKIILPIYIILSSSINFIISYIIFFVFLLISGFTPGAEIFGILPLLLLQQMIAVGMGMFVGVLNVFQRDVGQVVGIIMQFWFWITPLVYMSDMLPDALQTAFKFNFMIPIMDGYHNIFVYHEWPYWGSMFYPLIVAALFLIVGGITYKKLNKEMVDVL